MGKADLGSVVVGVILLMIAGWIFVFLDDPPARYVGTGVLAVIGLAAIAAGFAKARRRAS